jgi:hypothetical protein
MIVPVNGNGYNLSSLLHNHLSRGVYNNLFGYIFLTISADHRADNRKSAILLPVAIMHNYFPLAYGIRRASKM